MSWFKVDVRQLKLQLLMLAMLFVFLAGNHSEASTYRIPIKFHIISNFEVPVKGVVAHSWITPEEIEQTIMPEVNRIWRTASIQWEVASIIYHPVNPSVKPKKIKKVADFLAAAKRDAQGKSNPKRIKKLVSLLDLTKESSTAVNVYFTPYLGQASQGNARRKQRRVFVTQWSDKMFRGKQPPIRFPLLEGSPMRQGSVSRTLAHELGHILALKHPNKSTQKKFDRLMGGKKAGYELTFKERAAARVEAQALLRNLSN